MLSFNSLCGAPDTWARSLLLCRLRPTEAFTYSHSYFWERIYSSFCCNRLRICFINYRNTRGECCRLPYCNHQLDWPCDWQHHASVFVLAAPEAGTVWNPFERHLENWSLKRSDKKSRCDRLGYALLLCRSHGSVDPLLFSTKIPTAVKARGAGIWGPGQPRPLFNTGLLHFPMRYMT